VIVSANEKATARVAFVFYLSISSVANRGVLTGSFLGVVPMWELPQSMTLAFALLKVKRPLPR
jgi:hypothetical protein